MLKDKKRNHESKRQYIRYKETIIRLTADFLLKKIKQLMEAIIQWNDIFNMLREKKILHTAKPSFKYENKDIPR